MMMFMPMMFMVYVPVGAERPGDLLARQQPVGDRPAVLHELADRRRPSAAGASAGASAGSKNAERADRTTHAEALKDV